MKTTILYIVTLAVFACAPLWAQDNELIVEPTAVGTLNDIIRADTVSGGQRANPDRVYVLRRNAIYKTNGEIINDGFTLRIKAEGDPGDRNGKPIIMPTVGQGGDAFRPFTILGDFELDGVYVASVDDRGGFIERMIRVRVDSASITLRNCWFEGTAQSFIRFDNVGGSLLIENCIGSYAGRTFIPNNGRIIDVRTNCNSIIVRNSTFYNITSRALRMQVGRYLGFASFTNNTFVNFGQTIIDYGQTALAEFKNNLIINGGFVGSLRDGNLVDLTEIAPANEIVFDLVPVSTQTARVSNNWFYYTNSITNAWADSITPQNNYSPEIFAASETDPMLTTEEGMIRLENSPVFSRNIIQGMLEDQFGANNGTVNIENGNAPDWNILAAPFYQVITETLPLPWEFPLSFSYSPTELAATFGDTGGPVGDPNWPLKNIELITGLDGESSQQRTIQAYPNPVVSQIQLQLKGKLPIRHYQLFDGQGRAILQSNYGDTQLNLDMSQQPSGVYMVMITDSKGQAHTHKFIKQ